MTDFPDGIVIEARKAGLKQAKRKAADGTWFDVHDITFEIHPNDTNSPLSNMPLGTRVALVVTQLREDGAEKPPQTQTAPERVKGGPRSKRAGTLCGQEPFQNWLWQGQPPWIWEGEVIGSRWEDRTADLVRKLCGCIESRAELDHDDSAGAIWDDMERDYRAAMTGQTTEALQTMAEDGR